MNDVADLDLFRLDERPQRGFACRVVEGFGVGQESSEAFQQCRSTFRANSLFECLRVVL